MFCSPIILPDARYDAIGPLDIPGIDTIDFDWFDFLSAMLNIIRSNLVCVEFIINQY